MTELSKGGNAPLAAAGRVDIAVAWQWAPGDLDVVAFALTSRGKVPGDDWFLFFNQPRSPDGSLTLDLGRPGQARFTVDLDALPGNIDRCAFAAVVEEGSFQGVRGLEIQATGVQSLVYRQQEAFSGKALILAELYRHGGGWKFRAVGQGFADGLAPLAQAYGVDVADEGQAPPPPAPDPLPPPRPAPDPAPEVRPTPPPRPAPAPPPDNPPAQGSRLPLVVLVVVLLAALGGGGWWYLQNHPPGPAAPPAGPVVAGNDSAPPPAQGGGECRLETEELYQHYHQLGENYARIRDLIATSDEVRRTLRQMTREEGFDCSDRFLETNRQHIDRLAGLRLEDWMAENTRLNICAGQLNDRIEARIQTEDRNTVLQRLIDEADRGRALESDLTNIARELAYFRNKAQRLIEAFEANIEACTF